MKKSKTSEKELLYEIASDNLFMDFGYPPEEAINLNARADIMIFIRKHIRNLKWSQRKAAAEYGIPQPRIAEIMSLKIEKFSVDQLLKYLSCMGMQVKIKIEPATSVKQVFRD
jgi:predicted XRE-type DNA-binding protein